jgi:hypothetical protein
VLKTCNNDGHVVTKDCKTGVCNAVTATCDAAPPPPPDAGTP